MADIPQTQVGQSQEAKITDDDLDFLIKYMAPGSMPDDELCTEDCPEPNRIEAVVSGCETFNDAEKSHVESGCKHCAIWIAIANSKIDSGQILVNAG